MTMTKTKRKTTATRSEHAPAFARRSGCLLTKRQALKLLRRNMRGLEFLAVTPERVEGVEPGLAAPERQVAELRFAVAAETDDFAVQHRRAGAEFAGDALVQRRKRSKGVAVPRNQAAIAALDVNQRSKVNCFLLPL
jgi:hypothetical protein